MRKKLKTTPLQREILWLLADTGQAGLLNLLRSLEARFLTESPDGLLAEVERSLRILRRADFLYLIWQLEDERKPMLWTESSDLSLPDLIARDATGAWSLQEVPNAVDIIVQLTVGGVEALEIIAAQSTEPTPTWRSK